MFQSIKVYDGFSTCFRQWRAEGTHCKFLHGYGTSFKVVFEGELDERNWVYDFGGMKRATAKIQGKTPNEFFAWLLDHTVIIAQDDPELDKFYELSKAGVIQLRVLPNVGAEQFAKYLYDIISLFLMQEIGTRVKVVSVEFKEHEKNSAIYYLNK